MAALGSGISSLSSSSASDSDDGNVAVRSSANSATSSSGIQSSHGGRFGRTACSIIGPGPCSSAGSPKSQLIFSSSRFVASASTSLSGARIVYTTAPCSPGGLTTAVTVPRSGQAPWWASAWHRMQLSDVHGFSRRPLLVVGPAMARTTPVSASSSTEATVVVNSLAACCSSSRMGIVSSHSSALATMPWLDALLEAPCPPPPPPPLLLLLLFPLPPFFLLAPFFFGMVPTFQHTAACSALLSVTRQRREAGPRRPTTPTAAMTPSAHACVAYRRCNCPQLRLGHGCSIRHNLTWRWGTT
eukprot:m.216861 g.216861  ORF g.216861 m.216861 type:complete len:300 (-) comp18662_c0_seq1:864-1763(-)